MENTLPLQRTPGRRAQLIEYLDAPPPPNDELFLSTEMKWFVSRLGHIPLGVNLLLSGDPGVGKSTLALQIAAAAATLGQPVLYIATEQQTNTVQQRFKQLCTSSIAMRYLIIKDDLYDVSLLPQLLANQLLNPGADLYETKLVIIDSLQGGSGICPQDKRTWSSVLEYFRSASSSGVTTLALAHMTKGKSISGPRTLEHACDATLLMRHGASCRTLIVAKNRFGSAQMDPFALTIENQSTRLEPSPVGTASTTRVSTIGYGGIVEVEVAITSVRGDRGFVKSPGLTRIEIETIVDLVERLVPEAKSLWALGVTVRAPDGIPHRRDHNLAVAVALIAALKRINIPKGILFVGDLSLEGEVRPPSNASIGYLEDAQAIGSLDTIQQVILSSKTSNETKENINKSIRYVNSVPEIASLLGEYHD
jgi:DNA repair protein RadA/Sms